MNKQQRFKNWLACCLLVVVSIVGYLYWQNHAIVVSEYHYTDANVPAAFAGFKILQVSDLHNHDFGDGGQQLLAKVTKAQPDVIILTGDLIDSQVTNCAFAAELAAGLVAVAPTYYVTGNHEAIIADYEQLEAELIRVGVNVLRNQLAWITRGEAKLALMGLDEPMMFQISGKSQQQAMYEALVALQQQAGEQFQILLAHRPEYFEMYWYQNVPIVFVGHAHGGQIRLPFTEGLFAPGQGWLPTLTSGLHTYRETTMVVSRGLGNSKFPFRIQNRPELVVVTLNQE
ncbi:MAG: metallophosphoesterase [Culicoidibacterales bacterium]